MRVLAKVVQSLVLLMLHALEHLVLGSFVALQLVRYDHAWYKALLLEELAKESLGCLGISMTLHQEVKHVALRIYCTPQVILLSFNLDDNFIKMPSIRETRSLTAHLIGVLLPKLVTPFPNGLVGYLNPAIQHHLLNVSLAQGKAVVEPDTVTNDFDGKTVTRIHGQNRQTRQILYLSLAQT